MIYPHGTPTQPEIIAIALSKLDLKSTDVFVDIGCGSGSVSISAARIVQWVYAIDNRDKAVHATSSNLKRCGLDNVTVLKGEASSLLPELDMDCAFLGGSKNIEQVLDIVMKKASRFIVSAVRLETAVTALDLMKKNNRFCGLLQIQISRGNDLAGGTMLKNENPVFLISGGEQC